MSGRGITIADVRARRREILRILAARGAANPRVFAYVGLINDLEEELATLLGRPVHVTELRHPGPEFARGVQGDAVPL